MEELGELHQYIMLAEEAVFLLLLLLFNYYYHFLRFLLRIHHPSIKEKVCVIINSLYIAIQVIILVSSRTKDKKVSDVMIMMR